jgi:hypothetical protein
MSLGTVWMMLTALIGCCSRFMHWLLLKIYALVVAQDLL